MMRAPDERIGGHWASERVAALPPRIHQAVWQWVESDPDAVAVAETGLRWRYADLAAAVERAAGWLAGLGLRAGDRLMVVSENGHALVALLLACSRLDVWIAIINARLAANEIDAIAAHCQPRRVLFTVAVSTEAAVHAARHGAATVDAGDLGTLAVTPLNAAAEPSAVTTDGGQVAAMIYTSGTTGQPKGVMLTHRGILFIAVVSGGLRNLAPGRNVYGVLPTSHVFGLSSVAVGAVVNGACLHPVARFDPADLVAALAERDIGVLQGVPAMYARTLEYLQRERRTLRAPALVYASSGGAPLDLDLKARVEQTFGTPLHNGYGLTEASPTISQTRIGECHRTTTVGKLLPGLEACLRTPDGGGEVAPGEVGQLWVRGPIVMKGYFRDAAATGAAIDADGWLDTGDLARFDDDGNLFIVGRAKELIIRSGFNVYPPDVEAVLNAHPLVTLSAVVGRAVDGNEEVVAYVQTVPGAALSEVALAAFAAERLSPYKRPSKIIFMAALPATASGKILKSRLRDLAATGV